MSLAILALRLCTSAQQARGRGHRFCPLLLGSPLRASAEPSSMALGSVCLHFSQQPGPCPREGVWPPRLPWSPGSSTHGGQAAGNMPAQATQTLPVPVACPRAHLRHRSVRQLPLPFPQKTQGTTRTTKMHRLRTAEPLPLKGTPRCRRTSRSANPRLSLPGQPPAFKSSCHIKANTENHYIYSSLSLMPSQFLTLLYSDSVKRLPPRRQHTHPSRVFTPARRLLLLLQICSTVTSCCFARVTAVRSQAHTEAGKSTPFPSKGSREGRREKGRDVTRGQSRPAQGPTQNNPGHAVTCPNGPARKGGWKHPWEPNHSPTAPGNASHQQHRKMPPPCHVLGCPGRHSSSLAMPGWRWDAPASPVVPLTVFCVTVEGPHTSSLRGAYRHTALIPPCSLHSTAELGVRQDRD